MSRAWNAMLCTLVLGILFGQARACVWDRDTLATEARGRPTLIDVALGRIDRWPDEVYRVRLEAMRTEVESWPDRLDLYDDAAVACDRLGRHDEALDWMRRKRDALDRYDTDNPLRVEHEYRWLANRGTFHMHRWIATGASRDDMADVVRAEEDIAAAIKLNPDAHFGREPVQLAVIRRVRHAPPEALRPDPYAHQTFLFNVTGMRASLGPQRTMQLFDDTEMPTDALIEGLAGLITLGAAWQSVDVYASLALALAANGDNAIAELTAERARTLIDSGRPSLFYPNDDADRLAERAWLNTRIEHTEAITSFAKRGAAWADRVNTARDQHILNRLREGAHPDTHPDFMATFVPERRPRMPSFNPPGLEAIVGLAFFSALIAIVLIAAIRHMRGG